MYIIGGQYDFSSFFPELKRTYTVSPLPYENKAVNREDKLSRRYRDRDLAKFERSRRYRER